MNFLFRAFLAVVVGLSVQISQALDPRDIEIQVNTALEANTAFKPAVLMKVGALRKVGIETLLVTIHNKSQDTILITPNLLIDMTPHSKETVGDILWHTPRRINGAMSSVGVFGIIGTAVYAGVNCLGQASIAPLTTRLVVGGFAGSCLLIAFAGLNMCIEKFVWNKACQGFLWDAVTVQPGQKIEKFICVPAHQATSSGYACKIYDMQDGQYTIQATVVAG